MNLHANLIGRFGNQAMIYCAARKLAALNGWTFSHSPWVGERIFDIPKSLNGVTSDKTFQGYGQQQEDLLYSRRDVLSWLRLKPDIQAKLDAFVPQGEIVAHLRRGDYADLNYPLVSKRSYYRAAVEFGFNPERLEFITEETPLTRPEFEGELSFLPDFYRLLKAKVIFRGNSSFSWWASTLSNAQVYAPVIDGRPGGVESDCDFVAGNWPRLCSLDCVTDLHLKDE